MHTEQRRRQLEGICAAYGVPPWLVDPSYPKPRRFPRTAFLRIRITWRYRVLTRRLHRGH